MGTSRVKSGGRVGVGSRLGESPKRIPRSNDLFVAFSCCVLDTESFHASAHSFAGVELDTHPGNVWLWGFVNTQSYQGRELPEPLTSN